MVSLLLQYVFLFGILYLILGELMHRVCVRYWVNLYTEGSLCKVLGELIHRGKFVLGFG